MQGPQRVRLQLSCPARKSDSETISFLIKQSKTDQIKKGHFVYIFNLSSPIQPYQAVREYLRLRISQAKSPLEPLFLDHAGNPVSRTWFQKQLKSILLSAGISATNFSSHSFRIGAATSAAQKGLTNTKSKPQVDGLQKLFKATSERTSSTSNQPTKLSFHKKPGASFPGFFLPVQITRLARLPLLTHLGCELPSPARWRRVPPGYPTLPFRLYLSDSES